MGKKVRCGIIGCGVIAPLHIECIQRIENAEIKWACDLVSERATRLAERYSVPSTSTDYGELLADPELDAVHVCTDHLSHAEIVVAALDAGKHVICEKALTAHPDGLDAMSEAAKRHPELVFTGIFQHRFEPINRYLKRLIDEEAFGKLLTANVHMHCLRTNEYYEKDEWRGTREKEGGGVLINQAVHFIDVLAWIMGGIDGLSGQTDNFTHGGVIEVEDTAVAALRFKNGALGVLEATASTEQLTWEHVISLHGSTGAIEVRNNKPTKIAFKDPKMQERVECELATINDDEALASGKVYYGPGHPSQIGDFVEAIATGGEPFIASESARHTVDIVHAVYESCRDGKWVKIRT